MSEQNNTEHKTMFSHKRIRVVLLELQMSEADVLKYVPSVCLPEVLPLLSQADELKLRLRIERKTNLDSTEEQS